MGLSLSLSLSPISISLQAQYDLVFAMDDVAPLGLVEPSLTVDDVLKAQTMESHDERVVLLERERQEKAAKKTAKAKAKELAKMRKAQAEGMGGGSSMPGMGSDSMSAAQQAARDRTAIPGASFGGGGGGMGNSAFNPLAPAAAPTMPTGAGGGGGMSLGGGASKKQTRQTQLLAQLQAEGEIGGGGLFGGSSPDSTASAQMASTPTAAAEDIELRMSETMRAQVSRDGGIDQLEVKGDVQLMVNNSSAAHCAIEMRQGAGAVFKFSPSTLRTHPNIDKGKLTREAVLMLKDAGQPYPTANALGVIRWMFRSKDEAQLPLFVNAWPTAMNGRTQMSVEFQKQLPLAMVDCVVSIPIGGADAQVGACEGQYQYGANHSTLEWRPDLSAEDGCSLEFSVPQVDDNIFFPINVSFSSATQFAGVEVGRIRLLSGSGEPRLGVKTALTGTLSIV